MAVHARLSDARGGCCYELGRSRSVAHHGHLVHGFADVTGVVADFLEALVSGARGTVIDRPPPDPAAPEQDDPVSRF